MEDCPSLVVESATHAVSAGQGYVRDGQVHIRARLKDAVGARSAINRQVACAQPVDGQRTVVGDHNLVSQRDRRQTWGKPNRVIARRIVRRNDGVAQGASSVAHAVAVVARQVDQERRRDHDGDGDSERACRRVIRRINRRAIHGRNTGREAAS